MYRNHRMLYTYYNINLPKFIIIVDGVDKEKIDNAYDSDLLIVYNYDKDFECSVAFDVESFKLKT